MISSYVLGLREGEQYLIFSAVRGPDIENEASLVLKARVTARLRGILFSEDSAILTIPFYCITRDPLTDEDIECVKVATPHVVVHYTLHLASSVRVTQSHPIWNGKAENLLSALSQRGENDE